MKTLLKIAWRSIWRNPRRTLISMSAVGVGLFLVIVWGSILASILGDAKEQLDKTGMGHVEVNAPGWRAHHRTSEAVADPAALVAGLDLPPGTEAGWRVVSRALVSSARGSEGVELQGVDWAREAQLSLHVREVREGARPEQADERGILIGEKLAERLRVKVGSKVRLMAQRADGEIGAELFRVRGVFHSISPAISQRRVLVGESAARKLLGVGAVAHQLVFQLDRAAEADALAGRLRAKLGPGYEVLSYGELLPALKAMEDWGDKVVLLAALFIYGLVGLGILNTLLMSVMERSREFGVLRAIGTRPGRVVGQVLGESFWIATLSGLLGLCAGLAMTWYGSSHALLSFGGKAGEGMEYAGAVLDMAAKTRFQPVEALKAASLVYLMALFTALYPAWKVARMPPAKALHSS